MLITTPIFYVNAKPHLGHAYTMVLADVYYRYRKYLIGESTNILRTGCDEHGSKIHQAAMLKGIPELIYCKGMSNEFENLARALDVEYSSFVRTTDDDHKEKVVTAWNQMVKCGDIYKGKYSGWYSVPDESFYRDDQVEKLDENQFISKETRSQVSFTREENYMFRMTKYKDTILDWIGKERRIVPSSRANDIEGTVKNLSDISISRPRNKVPWGIQVPNEPEHT